jgi:hypothetical protein
MTRTDRIVVVGLAAAILILPPVATIAMPIDDGRTTEPPRGYTGIAHQSPAHAVSHPQRGCG